MNQFTKAISFIFHPVFIPMIAFLMYMQIDHYAVATLHNLTDFGFWFIFAIIAMFTCILPILGINTMRSTGMVSNWELTEKKERVPVLIMTSIFLCFLYYMFTYLESKSGSIFENFYGVIMGAIVLTSIGALVSNFWKISLHSMGISGLAGAMIGLTATLDPITNHQEMIYYNSVILLLVGVVGFARLHQNAHNITQVLVGMLVGFSVEFLIINNGWYF